MTSNVFSVGRDCQLVVIGPFGRVDLSHVTGFDARQQTAPVRVDRIDGTRLAAELPKGWEGTFERERGTSAVDDMVAAMESAYHAGNHVAPGTLYQYVSETDGSTSTYQFDGVAFKLTQAGNWRGDAAVKQRLDFFATTRKRV